MICMLPIVWCTSRDTSSNGRADNPPPEWISNDLKNNKISAISMHDNDEPGERSISESEARFTDELNRLSIEFRYTLVNGDKKKLIELIPDGGLGCVDDVIKKDELISDLNDHTGWFNWYMFGSGKPPKSGIYPSETSMPDYFSNNDDIVNKVGLIRVAEDGKYVYACIRYTSKGDSNEIFPPEFCFSRRDGRWFLAHHPSCL